MTFRGGVQNEVDDFLQIDDVFSGREKCCNQCGYMRWLPVGYGWLQDWLQRWLHHAHKNDL
jgi:hypothetical protein